MDKQKLTVRRVTKDDYDNLMDIVPPGEIYSGTDYLPDYFHLLLDMPNVEAYAVLDGDKFISFTLVTIVDDGKTVIPRAGRTHKDYVGHGVSGLLFPWFEQASPKRHLLRYQAATGGSHVKAIQRQIENGIISKVLQQEFRYYTSTSKTDIVGKIQSVAHIRISAKLMSVDGLAGLLSDPHLCSRLFPEERIIVDWVPYRPMKSNAYLMKTKRTSVVSSDVHHAEQTMLTFLSYFHAPLGLVCNFDIYGNLDSRLKEHLLLHFDNILPHARSEKIIIRMFCRQGTKGILFLT